MLTLSHHQFGKLDPRKPLLIHRVPSGNPLDVAFTDEGGTELLAVLLYVNRDVFMEQKLGGNVERDFMCHVTLLCCLT